MTNLAAAQAISPLPPAAAYPPRYWWLKRLLLAGLVWLLAMVGLRIVWGVLAERRLQAALAAYRAAGQPVTLEDFKTAPIPDEQNAAVALRAAAKLLSPAPGDLGETYKLLRHNRAYLDATATAFLEERAPALAWIRKARGQSRVDWGHDPNARSGRIGYPADYSEQREVARVIGAAAIYHHVLGDDFEAVECLRDTWMLGQRVGECGPELLALLVQYAIEGLTLYHLEALLPVLAVDAPPPSAAPSARAATRSQLVALRDEMLDESALREGWRRGMWYERANSLLLVRNTAAGTAPPGVPPTAAAGQVLGAIAGPLLTLNNLHVYVQHTRAGDAGLIPAYPQASRFAGTDEPTLAVTRSAVAGAAHIFSDMMLGHQHTAFQMMFRQVAVRRLAPTAIAIRMYELDHGRRPERLDELVPEYLPAVPIDCFDPGNGPIRYVSHAASPVLYSLGPDGEDDGGETGAQSSRHWSEFDVVFYLNGDRPHRISSATTAATGTGPASAPAGEEEPDPGAAEGQPDASAPPAEAAGATGGPAGATDNDSEFGAHDDRIRQDPASGGK